MSNPCSSTIVPQPTAQEVEKRLDEAGLESVLREMLSRYPAPQGALLEVLWLAQETLGWLPHAAVQWAARTCDCSPAHAWGVATFYTMYKKMPTGRFLLQICQNISCHIKGGEEIIAHAEKLLGVDSRGGTSADGLFTLLRVECLGACGNGPALLVNDDFATEVVDGKLAMPEGVGLTRAGLERILDWCREEARRHPQPIKADQLGKPVIGTGGHPGSAHACAQPQSFDYAPPPPALEVKAVRREDGSTVLSWKAAPEVAEIAIEKAPTESAAFTRIGQAGPRDKEWIDPEGRDGERYRLVAVSRDGRSARPSTVAQAGGAP